MGNSVSCFDPVREHPPYSWPKDHPDRAAAIQEKKRQRRQQKIVGTQGNARSVVREEAKDVVVAATPDVVADQEINLNENLEEQKVKDSEKVEDKDVDVVPVVDEENKDEDKKDETDETPDDVVAVVDANEKELLETTDEDEERDDHLVEEQVEEKEGEEQSVEEHTKDIDPTLLVPSEHDVKEEEEGEGEEGDTTPLKEDEDKDEDEDEDEEEEEKEEEKEEETIPVVPIVVPVAEEKDDVKDDDKVENQASKEVETSVDDSTIDNRRALFEEGGEGELPEPKELARDVHDPVTGDMITLAEYRRRQMERAEGLVKERVEQYEDVVDITAKEAAELAAIEAQRTEAMEKHHWKFKSEHGDEEGDMETEGATVGTHELSGTKGSGMDELEDELEDDDDDDDDVEEATPTVAVGAEVGM